MKKKLKNKKLTKEQVREVMELSSLPEEEVKKWTWQDLFNAIPREVGQFWFDYCHWRNYRSFDVTDPTRKLDICETYLDETGNIKTVRCTRKNKFIYSFQYKNNVHYDDGTETAVIATNYHSTNFARGCIAIWKETKNLQNWVAPIPDENGFLTIIPESIEV